MLLKWGCVLDRLLSSIFRALRARIARPSSWDREFVAIDFLTLLDLKTLFPAARLGVLAPHT